MENWKKAAYLEYLIAQFIMSTEINKQTDWFSDEFITAFASWLKKCQLIGDSYKKFIDYLNVKPSHEYNIVEVGKGKYDSIAMKLDLPIITEFTEGISEQSRSPIIDNQIRIVKGVPILNISKNCKNPFDLDCMNRFVTHNPYEERHIAGWEYIHNFGNNITVGVFGDIHDKDKDYKIAMLKRMRDKIVAGTFKEEYSTDRDMYFYAIASNRRVKGLSNKR